jgi:hypothetical protein
MAVQADLKQRLEKKGTFEAALAELLQAVQACSAEADLQQLLPLVKRAFTLLKTRYSNVAWWRKGLNLFVACKVGASMMALDALCCSATTNTTLCDSVQEHPQLPHTAGSQLDAYIAEASSFASDEQPEQAAAAAPAPTLGELLFGLPPRQVGRA